MGWRRATTLGGCSLRGSAVSLMGRARAGRVPSLDAFSAPAWPAGREARRMRVAPRDTPHHGRRAGLRGAKSGPRERVSDSDEGTGHCRDVNGRRARVVRDRDVQPRIRHGAWVGCGVPRGATVRQRACHSRRTTGATRPSPEPRSTQSGNRIRSYTPVSNKSPQSNARADGRGGRYAAAHPVPGDEFPAASCA